MRFHLLGLACLVLIGGLLPAAPALGQTDPFFTRGVQVDVTAETATKAREQALVRAQVQALQKVMRRLTLKDDHPFLPSPPSSQVVDMVRDVSIEDERSSPVRYIASVSVRFTPDAVRDLLRGNDIPFAETVSRPVLVVPVFRSAPDAAPVLWEETNPWLATWIERPEDSGLVPVLAPFGDLSDISMLPLEAALGGDQNAAVTLAQRYGADRVILAEATASGPTDSPEIAVEQQQIAPTSRPVERFTISGAPDRATAMQRAAEAIDGRLEELWKRQQAVGAGETAQLTVLMPLGSLREWLILKRRLRETPLIERFDLQAMKKDRAQVTLYFSGSESQLMASLRQTDLDLAVAGGYWTLRRIDQ